MVILDNLEELSRDARRRPWGIKFKILNLNNSVSQKVDLTESIKFHKKWIVVILLSRTLALTAETIDFHG